MALFIFVIVLRVLYISQINPSELVVIDVLFELIEPVVTERLKPDRVHVTDTNIQRYNNGTNRLM